MDKKIKIGIIAIIIIVIAIIAASSYLGNSSDNNATHIVVTVPGHAGEPEAGFNPLTGWGCGHLDFNPLIQSTLFKTGSDGNFTGDLATDYKISSDELIWTVNIRDNVKFSDNTSLTAKDVAFTFNEARSSNSQLDMSNLDHATALNDTSVEFKLKNHNLLLSMILDM